MKLTAIGRVHGVCLLMGLLLCGRAAAQEAATPDRAEADALEGTVKAVRAPAATQATETRAESDEEEAKRTFAGLRFGVGLSATFDTGKHRRYDEAIIDSEGLVRITKKSNALARLMLETHYFWVPRERVGHGPFVAVQPGQGEVINALGFGWMVGFRRAESNDSFNVGVGFVLDPTSQVLGHGFEEDKPAPPGETEVRPLVRDQGGFLLMASFGW